MPYTNANEAAAVNNKRLVYYIIIDGKSKYSACYSYHKNVPDIWIRVQRKVSYFATMYKGIVFSVYDNEPFCDKEMVYALFEDVLTREGLQGE